MLMPLRTTLLTLTLLGTLSGLARADDEAKLREGCSWLERAIAREPTRDDAFMMFMQGMRPKCGALLEGLARKDGSVTPKTIGAIVKELQDLRDIVDAEWKAAHPNDPDPAAGPTPEEKAAAEKAAAEKAAADKAAAEKAAAETAEADRAAKEAAEAERLAREAEKKAAEDAKMSEKERKAAEKKAAEEAKRAEKERLAAEKQAAEEAKRAEKQAAEEAKRAEKERLAAEKKAAAEAAKQSDAEARARAEAERLAAEQAEKQRLEAERMAREEKEQLDRDLAEAERIRREQSEKQLSGKVESKPAARLDGTWEQPQSKVLDRNTKRTLNLLTKGKKVEGELYEEVWYPAPTAWIDRSCGGNTTFRMVTTARVTGEVSGRKLELRRDAPRILACTCESRCTVEERRRGMSFEISVTGNQLTDDRGVFSRPGAATVATSGGGASDGGAQTGTPRWAGAWETSPFAAQDRKVVWRLEVAEEDGKLVGTLTERSSQALPLQSWKDRFCDGASTWEWVFQWKVDVKLPKGRKASVTVKDGENLLCTCPSKCKPPDAKRTLELELGVDGLSLSDGPRVFERR